MLQAILEGSLRHRTLVLILASLWVAYGVWSAQHAKLEVLPDFAPPQADIQTEAPGLAPEQVERFVTLPVESALGGVSGLETLRSESIQGLSVVRAVFADGTDPYRVRQLLAENLGDVATRLPPGVAPPHISPLTSATMDVLKFGLTSDALTPMQLRTLADWTLRPRLLMVPGVARINVFGGEVDQIQIQPRSQALVAHGLGLVDLLTAAQAAVANAGAGYVDTPNQRIVIEVASLEASATAIGQAIVKPTPSVPLRIADVARVREAPALAFGDALIGGEPGVLLAISAAYGANTVEVTHAVEAALAELEPALVRQQVTLHAALHRPANFVDNSLKNLRSTLLIGSALVVAVLFAFLRNARAALVSLTAIPISLLSAVIVLTSAGFSLNTMSLGGLAIAIGNVVDDAIVDVENILRRLRENVHAGHPKTTYAVVLAASLEVRGSVIFATFAVAFVFLPLLALRGLQGKFFAPLALAYLAAVMASLVTALVVTPALTLTFFGRRPPPAEMPGVQARLRSLYRTLLLRVRARPWLPFAALACVLAGGVSLIPFLGGEFMPDFREGHLVLQVATVPGTGLAEMRRVGRQLADGLHAIPGVAAFEQQMGRAEAGEDTWGTNASEFHVELKPDHDADATTEAVRALLAATPGIQFEVVTFVGDRISETISGETAEFTVGLFSEDLDLLDRKSDEVARVLAQVPGAVDVQGQVSSRGPHVAVTLRPASLALQGFSPDEVLRQLQIAFSGGRAGQVFRGEQPLDVMVLPDASERRSPDQVGALLVRNPAGAVAPLATLARVEAVEGRDTISHEGARRRQVVTANVVGRDVTSFAAEARARIARQVRFPAGSYFTIGGASEARAAAVRDLALQGAAGALGVLLLLALAAGHWRNLLLLVVNAPLALVGGLLSTALVALLEGRPASLSLGSLVGFVTLFGVTLRNSIMIVSHYRHLVASEGRTWNLETALDGACDRVVPVLMTAGVTALALLPVALRSHEAGGEIDGPMAVVILGGLVTSTVLNLLVLPWLSLHLGRFEPAEAAGD
jgi:CzcA family heavy metal efflux pump